MAQARRITVVGSLNMDLVTRVSRFPSPGETRTAESFETGPGGKGANQAVACARLSRRKPNPKAADESPHLPSDPIGDGTDGDAAAAAAAAAPAGGGKDDARRAAAHTDDDDAQVLVKMVGAVGGDDVFGESLRAALGADGVDVSDVRRMPGVRTGVACITVETATGENYILLAPNANHAWTPGMVVDWSSPPAPAPLPDLILLQLEIPLETVLQILQTARRVGVDVLLNPAPAVALPEDAYPGITHLIVNESEAAILSGTSLELMADETHLSRVCDMFLDRGVRFAVVVTLGGRGAFYAYRQPPESGTPGSDRERRCRGLVPAEKVSVVDSTAAGDTFVGAYAVQIVRAGGDAVDVRRAVEWATKAAACTVQRKGAQSAIPWSDEIDAS